MSYKDHLSKDKVLARVIKGEQNFKLEKQKNVFSWLCASIISQQLSTKVARVIHGRFLGLYNGNEPHPEEVLKTEFENLSSIGLSNSKTNYLRNVAEFALDKGLSPVQFKKMSDEEATKYLLQIKGVGRWTAEMLLMFALGREDVFSAGDLGIRTAMTKLYKLPDLNIRETEKLMHGISQKWSPYRTYACLHLWQWKDR